MLRLFLLLFFPISAYATIVASTNHIASIISVLGDDVEVIASSSSCPCHYSIKPSDISKIKAAEKIIYIDDKFEPFSSIIKEKSKNEVIQISDIEGVKIRKGNYHIWLNINYAKLILQSIDSNFIPEELDELAEYKAQKLSSIKHPILLSDSLEYLFDGTGAEPIRYYLKDMGIGIIEKIKDTEADIILADSSDNFDSIEEKIDRKITYIDCENWPKNGYNNHYRKLLDYIYESIQNTPYQRSKDS